MTQQLYVIDVFSLVFQVFHAVPEMTSPRGEPTNALFGFTRDLLNILRQKQPSHWICAFDSKGPGVREGLYPAYKANRKEMPEELKPQIPLIREVIEGFGIPLIEHDGWEADDVIATVVEQATHRDIDVIIVTNDKDARQLLGPRVRIYLVRKDSYLDAAGLLDDWGVRPDQVVDFQALVGDSVDNVPGVPLIGPKKATALLQQFGTLDGVLANADAAPGAKLRENLKQFADQARLSRTLVELNRQLPLNVDWQAAQAGQIDAAHLLDLCTRYGFRKMADEFREMLVAKTPAPEQRLTCTIVDNAAAFEPFQEALRGQTTLSLSIETTGADPMRADMVGWALSWQAETGWYLPVLAPPGQAALDPQFVADALRPLLERPEIRLTGHDVKQVLLTLRRAGIKPGGVGFDAMVGDYLLDAGARSHGLIELARKYLDRELTPRPVAASQGLFQADLHEVDAGRVARHAVEKAACAWELTGRIEAALREADLWNLYWDLERPLIGILAEMQHRGIRVDARLLREQSRAAGEKLQLLQTQIYALAGREFNIDSPAQLQTVLFEELNLPVVRKTKTGSSTDQDVLEQLAGLHPLPAKLIEHRRLRKLKSTYLDALPELVHPATGRIHASFNQVVAATGRLSSSDPNLQNIPVRTEEGGRVREAFLPENPEWRLLCADYSQVELRILAHYSGDTALCEAFARGEDVHQAVAAEIFGVGLDAVDTSMRTAAKAVNFGVIYGQSPFGLAQSLGISRERAEEFIDAYFCRFSGVDRFLRKLLADCEHSGYAKTILGRRRAISGIRSHGGPQRTPPERTAINTVIQGSAADLIKQAMINVDNRLRRELHPGRILLQIHDELVLETPAGRLNDLGRLVQEEMENALKLNVPLQVDLAAGINWLNVEPIELPRQDKESGA